MPILPLPDKDIRPLDYLRRQPTVLHAFYEGVTEGRFETRQRLRYVKSPLYYAISAHVDVHEFLARRLSPDEFTIICSEGQLRHVRGETDGSRTQVIVRNGNIVNNIVIINPIGPRAQEFIDAQGRYTGPDLFAEATEWDMPQQPRKAVYNDLIVLISQQTGYAEGEFTITEKYYLVYPTEYQSRTKIAFSDYIELVDQTSLIAETLPKDTNEKVEFVPEIEELDDSGAA